MNRRRRDAALLVFGAGAAFATSGPLARVAAPLHPLAIVCGRVVLAALVLCALDVPALGRAWWGLPRRQRGGIALAGGLLAADFALVVWGLESTSLPAAVTLVSLEPLSVVLVAWVLQKIAPTRLELCGVATATAGAVLVSRAAGQGDHRLAGDLIVVAAVILYGLYIAAARAWRGTLSSSSYAAMVYSFAAAASALGLALVPNARLWPVAPRSLWAVLGLAMIPTLIGHTAVQAA